ncbi:MAG: hypothetical protein QY309_12350 [Cyclobacteriaceae bacterium]|nr:MAG: hypothetical protein QY309_12350 [Cyclobacteriaceae bacterium]
MKSLLIIAYVSVLSPLIPLIVAFIRPTNLKVEQWFLVSLLCLSLLSDGLLWFFLDSGINNWPIVNIYLIVQIILLYRIFRSDKKSTLTKIFISTFLTFAVINFVFLQTPEVFNSRTSNIGALFIIAMALSYLYHLFKEMPINNILDMPMLWVAFAVLFYFAGTLFLFLLNNYLIVNQPENHQLGWVLHNILNIIKNLFFAVALWKYYKRSMLWK